MEVLYSADRLPRVVRGMTVEALKTAISADELAERPRSIDAGEMTLVLDACQSAESVQAKDFKLDLWAVAGRATDMTSASPSWRRPRPPAGFC